jgi:DNA-binding MarR family transcriptional regulator
MKTAAPEANAPLSLRLEDQLCFALHSTALKMTQAYRPLLEPLGLTYPQYLVMLVLWQADRQTVSEIGARLYLDSATLTPMLKRLEAQGFVARARSEDDERQVIVSLTGTGRSLRRRAQALPYQVFCATGCSPEEIALIKARLETLREHLIGSPVDAVG